MNTDTLAKFLCDEWLIANDQTFFHFGFRSGDRASAYLLYAQGAKGLLQTLQKQIDTYEAQNGTIDMTGYQLGQLSPIQRQK